MKFLALTCLLAAATFPAAAANSFRIATFDADVSPRLGEPLIWNTATTIVLDKLHAKGIIVESGRDRYVLCAVDWCGLGNRSHQLFREKIAKAAATTPDRVAVQTLHQHTAPYVDGTAYDLLREKHAPVTDFTDTGMDRVANTTALAVAEAAGHLQPFDRVGTGIAKVERVASARRLRGPDGTVITRFSTGGKSPDLAAAPEGPIDPDIRTVAFAKGNRTIARLYYYATHPQTWCCDGRASADILGTIRAAAEAQAKGEAHIYFTGCAGDVTVGKYNDGSDMARRNIEERLAAAMQRASRETQWRPVTGIAWRTASLRLPSAPDAAAKERYLDSETPEPLRYRSAIPLVFARRTQPLELSMLSVNDIRILHLPGEPMVEFQRYAQSLGAGRFVAVAGYGDIAPGYICTDAAYDQGGYEPSASNTTKGAEAALKQVLRELLSQP